MTAALLFFLGFLVLSAFDALYFHVYRERLAAHSVSQRERMLHVRGNIAAAALGLMLAWFEWRGLWILVPLLFFAAELTFSILDYLEEKRVRTPGLPEKAVHWILAGLHTAFALLALPSALAWLLAPGEVAFQNALTLPLTAASVLLFAAAIAEAGWNPDSRRGSEHE